MTTLTHNQSLQLIRDRLKERGDLPVFSASVNRVSIVGSDPEADAMALSVEILKDANLTTKVLKLANSPMFNRGIGKISHLSRAVVVLGFDIVKSAVLTLKFIDEFKGKHSGIDMTSMLVNAYLSGGFVRGVSAKCGIKDIEQVYICGLLHNLSNLVVAHTLPEQFRQIQDLQREHEYPRAKAEYEVLGTTFRKLGQEILTDWGFPQNVVKTLGEPAADGNTRIRNQLDLTAALSSLANQTMDLLYAEIPDTSKTIGELKHIMSKVSGIRKEEVTSALEQSFKQSCELAQAYGLNKRHLMPRLRNSEDEDLEKLAHQFSFYASSEINTPASLSDQAKFDDEKATAGNRKKPAVEEKADKTAIAAESKTTTSGDADLLLSILFEITTMMSQKAQINMIFAKVLEGMNHGIGLDRAVLCLLSPDHKQYIARLSAGNKAEGLKEYLAFPVKPKTDLFSKIIMEGNELLVADINQGDWRQQLPSDFQEKTGASGFMLAALRSKSRPLGLFYADNAISKKPMTSEAQRYFNQLAAQAQLALQMR
jgi:HD-like signal output (HDOD) protein